MTLFFSILGALLTILFVIGTHESAHFLMARLLKVKVLRFSIGFGKALFTWHDRSGTEYVFALIPLGGYVKMLDEGEAPVPKDQLPYAFNRQPFYKKFLIVLAGPFSNILCAFILYWLIFMIGFVTIKPIIGHITPHSIADEAGLKSNEMIESIDQHPVLSWTGALLRMMTHIGDRDHLVIQTETLYTHQKHDYTLNLASWHMDALQPDPLSSMGIVPLLKPLSLITRHIQYGPINAFYHAAFQVSNFVSINFLLFGKMITGKLSLQSLGGPMTIFESAGEAFNAGWLAFMGFLAFISIAIGVINLIPIPGLDGGHLLIQMIEWIIRRPLPEAYLNIIYRLGFIVILFFLFQAVMNDILRLR